jgi:hypothetical protein
MNVFPKFGFSVALRLMILCCGMLFGAASVQAQSTLDIPPFQSATWLSGVDATTALTAEIDGIDQTLAYSQPSNTHQLKMKHTLYSGILSSIQDGMPVNGAAQLNYYKLAPSTSTDVAPDPDMNANDWQTLFNDMVNLLTI